MTESKNINRRYFWQPVDKRSRQTMVDYLSRHFRYPTANSWNQSTSYACNMKVTHLRLDPQTVDRLLDLVFVPEFQEAATPLLQDFAHQHQYRWQAGFNGRSGGYLVLYQGELAPSGYRSYCTACGQKNYRSVADTGRKCGRCQRETRVDFPTTHHVVKTYPFRATDPEQDYEDWSLYELQSRTELVQSFDKLADEIVTLSLQMAETHIAAEEIIYTPVTRYVLREVCS